MKLTDPMWRALEKIYREKPSVLHPDGKREYYVTYSTAFALVKRGLLKFVTQGSDGRRHQTTGGPFMPEYEVEMTDLGRTLCRRRFDESTKL